MVYRRLKYAFMAVLPLHTGHTARVRQTCSLRDCFSLDADAAHLTRLRHHHLVNSFGVPVTPTNLFRSANDAQCLQTVIGAIPVRQEAGTLEQ
jgi:hypothetical protein